MDIFCQFCASKPGWPWDATKVIQHTCQRCFQFKPCNDYSWRKAVVNAGPAPSPKDLVPKGINPQAQCDLPKAKVVQVPPVPVYPVEPPQEAKAAVLDCSLPLPGKPFPGEPDRTEVDMALDALQPNRPGIKLQMHKKGA